METELKVSQQTQNFIEPLRILSEVWNKVYNALVAMHGEEQADKIMNGKYSTVHFDLEEIIYGYIAKSIESNINSGSREMI